ncbi:hypothetical protein [Magnetococcus sp. PR-3]|uniref:hypothetical protein n=1 Tax=Magnetococcus sp. PR-3 TaxID=3120355 RepID=UPI002FCE145A
MSEKSSRHSRRSRKRRQRKRVPLSGFRTVVVLAGALFFLWLLNQTIHAGMATLFVYLSDQITEKELPFAQERDDKYKIYKDALYMLERADSWQSGNPDYLFKMGTHHIRLAALAGEQKRRKAHYRNSIELYKQITLIRPSWGYPWINQALAKHRLGQDIRMIEKDMERANIFAPLEPGVQLGVIRLGYRIWDQLSSEMRHQVQASSDRLFAKPLHRTELLTAARSTQRWDELERLTRGDPDLQRHWLR